MIDESGKRQRLYMNWYDRIYYFPMAISEWWREIRRHGG